MRLLAQAKARGASLREGVEVREVLSNAVRCDDETLHADVIVNATGASAAELTPGLPIVPRKGHLAITDRYPGFCHHQLVELGYLTSAHMMTTESVAFNIQPRRTGQMLIGSSRELVGWDPSINHAVLGRMLRRATEFVPRIRDLSIIRCWTGFRPATPDKLPLIGPWEPTPGLWIAAGHEGLGITTSLATARLLADQIAGRPTEIDASPFMPARVIDATVEEHS
jgi:glycine/D-amino acid oxidase-like deaminating enzyme